MDRYNYRAYQECGAMKLVDYQQDFENIYKFYNWPAVQGAGYECLANINLMAYKNVTGDAGLFSMRSLFLATSFLF